jgi:mono/diheme cytochrome c family protein
MKIMIAFLVCVAAFGWPLGSSQSAAQGAVKNQSFKQEEVRLIESIQGPALYQAYCASCHGKDAKGGGAIAKSLKVPPANLTRIAARNAGKFPLMRIERIISGEEQTGSGHGPRDMPVWGPIFSQVTRDQDLGRVRIDNLARYLRDIQIK